MTPSVGSSSAILFTVLMTTFTASAVSAQTSYATRLSLDSDADGVIDLLDRDSDNDGILNVLEQRCNFSAGFNTDSFALNQDLTAGQSSGQITQLMSHAGVDLDLAYALNGTGEWEAGIQLKDSVDLGRTVIFLQPKNVSQGNGRAEFELIFSQPIFIDALTFSGLEFRDQISFSAFNDQGQTIELGAQNFTSTGEVVSEGDVATYVGNSDEFIDENYRTETVTLSLRDVLVKRLRVQTGKASSSTQNSTLQINDLAFCVSPDSDLDGVADYLDLDSDNDGLPDNLEAQATSTYLAPSNSFDSSGVDSQYPAGLTPINTSGGPLADYLNPDSDGDGLADNLEAGIQLSGTTGANGLDSAVEVSDNYQQVNGIFDSLADFPNSDNQGEPDWREVNPPQISLDTVAGDNRINLTEDDQSLTVSGQTQQVPDGQPVTVSLNGKSYTTTVNNNAWAVEIPAADLQALPATATLTANVSNLAGDAASPAVIEVSHSQALPTLTVNALTGDNIINLSEDDAPVVVTGSSTGLEDGQNVNITLNGKVYVATVNNNAWAVEIPAADLQALPASSELSATAANAAGDTAAPVVVNIAHSQTAPTLTVNPLSGDNIINLTEDDTPLTLSGTSSGLENGQVVSVSLNGKTYQATIIDNGWSVELPAADLQALPASSELSVSATSAAGDVTAPTSLTIEHSLVTPQVNINSVADDNIIQAGEADAGLALSGATSGVENGQSVSLSLNGKTYSAPVNNNSWSLVVPKADVEALPENSQISVSVSNKAGDAAVPATLAIQYLPAFAQDLDADGIPDTIETNADFDADGTVNAKDADSDNDGMPDSVEAGANPAMPVDSDGDGQFDFIDTDSDNDGISDAVEAGSNPQNPIDTDADGTPDFRDTDSDNDGILDAEEGTGDADNDGIPNYLDTDSDNDGLTDAEESAQDALGKPGAGNNVDSDNDGVPNYLDRDSDNDGISDGIEANGAINRDTDGDGIADYLDQDADNDGITDALELQAAVGGDSDNDGVKDRFDADADNDGQVDAGKLDANNNGIDDAVDAALLGASAQDLDQDGIDDTAWRVDTDGDGLPNYLDVDSDNDGLTDLLETRDAQAAVVDTDRNGRIDAEQATDTNNNGIADVVDSELGAPVLVLLDTDGDGLVDYLDLDSDADGLTDLTEAGLAGVDPNGDGLIGSGAFADNNGDGLADLADPTNGKQPAEFIDSDGDGIPDTREVDSNGDGVFDLTEAAGQDLGQQLDANQDGVVDDTRDANNDGYVDAIATHNSHPNRDLQADADNNGIADVVEDYLRDLGIEATADSDFDRDGYPDVIEAMNGGDALDGSEADDNGNGVPNWVEAADPDANGNTDNDADGFSDLLEQLINTDANVAEDTATLFGAAEAELLDINRYDLRSEKPVVWIDLQQAQQGVLAAGKQDGVLSLIANIGNYHLFNDPQDAQSTPVYQWTLAPSVAAAALLNGDDQAQLQLDPAQLATGVYQATLSVTLAGHESVVEHWFNVLDGQLVADNDRDGIANSADTASANIGGLHAVTTTTGYVMDADSPVQQQGNSISDVAVKLHHGNFAQLVQAEHTGLSETQMRDALGQISPDGALVNSFNSLITTGTIYDYQVTNLPYVGATSRVVLPLLEPLGEGAQLVQFSQNNGWQDFVEDANNSFASAPWVNDQAGVCPEAGSSDYLPGLYAGDQCVQLTVVDGGVNDADNDEDINGASEDGQGDVNGQIRGTWAFIGGGPILQKPIANKPATAVGRIETGVRGIGSFGGLALTPLLILLALRRSVRLPIKAIIVMMSLLLASFASQAQTSPQCYDDEQYAQDGIEFHRCKGWYGGLGLGMSWLEPNIVDAPETLDQTRDLLLPHIFVGYDLGKHWAVEAHYSRQGEATFESGAAIDYQHFGASAVYHWPSHLPGWHVLGKLGLSRLDTDLAQGRDDDGPFNFQQNANVNLSFGAGLEYMARSNWGARLEWFSVDDDSNELTLSVVKRFGRVLELPAEPEPEPVVVAEPEPEPEPELPPVCLVPDSVLDGIYFIVDSAEITFAGKMLLDGVIKTLSDYPGVQLAVRAYTDSRGSEAYNLKLSQLRADAVKAYLQQAGIADIDAQGLGEANPIGDNATEAGRAMNRRVEIEVVSRECGF